jgi:hypothetical protein
MIQTYAHQEQLHEARLDIKSLECLFSNLITEGTNCSPFESEIIVDKAKEIFAIGEHAEGNRQGKADTIDEFVLLARDCSS